jgi:uncharacterized protein (UPF0332 family)
MTPEQGLLLKKAEDSLRAAELLSVNGLYDFAASRAYYTMFYIAQAFLLGEGLAFSKHSAVLSAFGQQFARTGRIPAEFHRQLIEAAGIRNQGDYSLELILTEDKASTQITRAEQFLKLANQQIGPINHD